MSMDQGGTSPNENRAWDEIATQARQRQNEAGKKDLQDIIEQQQAEIESLKKHLKLSLTYIENIEEAIDGTGYATEEQIYENITDCDFNYTKAKSLLNKPTPPEGES